MVTFGRTGKGGEDQLRPKIRFKFLSACGGSVGVSSAGHKARLPIPEALWAAVAEAVREHGVFRASKVLCPEYGKLNRIAEARAVASRPTMAPATFLELVPPRAVDLAERLIELEGPRGKMRIQWKGATAPDLAGLSRVLWESATSIITMRRRENRPCRLNNGCTSIRSTAGR